MSEVLKVLCGICSDFYSNRDCIFVTKCGHVFHQQCLFRWLRVSHTCPQCRDNCLRHQCHRLYLNFEPLPRDEQGIIPTPNPSNFMSGYEWLNIDHSMDEELLTTFALQFGTNENDDTIYAARSYYKGDLVPCYYSPKKRSAIVPWGFKSHDITSNIEVLDISCDDAEYKWVAASNGDLPENALISGRTIENEPLYTARVDHEGQILYGKLHRKYYMAYVPFNDTELSKSHYEVLVRIPRIVVEMEFSAT